MTGAGLGRPWSGAWHARERVLSWFDRHIDRWVRRPTPMALAGMGAMACTVLLMARVLAPSAADEWRARGMTVKAPGTALRVFCAAPGHALRELAPGHTCPPGAVLAFA